MKISFAGLLRASNQKDSDVDIDAGDGEFKILPPMQLESSTSWRGPLKSEVAYGLDNVPASDVMQRFGKGIGLSCPGRRSLKMENLVEDLEVRWT